MVTCDPTARRVGAYSDKASYSSRSRLFSVAKRFTPPYHPRPRQSDDPLRTLGDHAAQDFPSVRRKEEHRLFGPVPHERFTQRIAPAVGKWAVFRDFRRQPIAPTPKSRSVPDGCRYGIIYSELQPIGATD
jgi:hypothetical protein